MPEDSTLQKAAAGSRQQTTPPAAGAGHVPGRGEGLTASLQPLSPGTSTSISSRWPALDSFLRAVFQFASNVFCYSNMLFVFPTEFLILMTSLCVSESFMWFFQKFILRLRDIIQPVLTEQQKLSLLFPE